MYKPILFSFLALSGISQSAAAETAYSFYGGWQTAPHSVVSGTHPDDDQPYSAVFGWDGKSFAPPPYYGAKATWWNGNTGTEIEFTHAKVYARDAERDAAGFKRFEFTDGLNLLTVNRLKRWERITRDYTPYVGAGVGFAFPHVDVLSNGDLHAYGYQVTGPAIRLIAGTSRPIKDDLSVFAEYQFTTSWNSGTLTGGGSFDTTVLTNAVNFGVTWTP